MYWAECRWDYIQEVSRLSNPCRPFLVMQVKGGECR